MGVPNSASLGTIGSLLWKLGDLLPRAGQEDGSSMSTTIWEELRDGVESIRMKLEKLSEVHDPPLTVNYWMKDARELSYDMDDFLDQCFLLDDRMACMDENEMISSGFRTRVDEVMEWYHRFKLEDVVLSRPKVLNPVASSHRLPSASAPVVVGGGMERPRNELLGCLSLKTKGGDDDENKVVSILGVEGVGKSTLAQQIWRTLGKDEYFFDCQAFVQASKKPDIRMILRSILLQVRPNQPPEACRVPDLVHDINKHLQDKRFFIVIDDLWVLSVWDAVSRAFPEGNCGSRIVTTTTIEDVALACTSYNPEQIFEMEPLSFDHSKELFIRTVFGSGKKCSQQLHGVSDEITRKCGGLPLAITCIGTLLASQPETVRQWEYVGNFLCNNLRTNPTSVEILQQVLNLCYSNLPQCLKTCLLYLSVYPENYLILKDDLVKQWIAEGFICTTEERDIVEVASSYFDELVSLGLIQRMDMSRNKELSYVVHPTVFEFITCKSIQENFVTTFDYSQSTVTLTEKIRRLSLHFGSATYATTPANIGLWRVRSFTFMGLLNCMPSLVDFKVVRVVILHVLGDNGDTNFPLTGICELLLLRYLQIKCNVSVELPDQMGCLKHLETLEVHERVASVPSEIFHLPRLLHLSLGAKRYPYPLKHLILFYLPTGMIPRPPRWFGHFRNLRCLYVEVRKSQMYGIDALAELWALRVVSLYADQAPTSGDLHFKKGAFPALKYFKYMCDGVMLLTFDKEAMPNLWRLHVGFIAHRGGQYGDILAGVQHLVNLHEIAASIGTAFGAEDSDCRAAESAFRDAIRKLLPSFMVTRWVRVDGEEYGSSSEKRNLIQEIEFSNEQHEGLKKHGVHKLEDLSINRHPVVLEEKTEEDQVEGEEYGSSEKQILIQEIEFSNEQHEGLKKHGVHKLEDSSNRQPVVQEEKTEEDMIKHAPARTRTGAKQKTKNRKPEKRPTKGDNRRLPEKKTETGDRDQIDWHARASQRCAIFTRPAFSGVKEISQAARIRAETSFWHNRV